MMSVKGMRRGLMCLMKRVMRSWYAVGVSIIHGGTPGGLVTIEAGVNITRRIEAWLRMSPAWRR